MLNNDGMYNLPFCVYKMYKMTYQRSTPIEHKHENEFRIWKNVFMWKSFAESEKSTPRVFLGLR